MRVNPFTLHHHHHHAVVVGGGTAATVLLLMLVTFPPLPVSGQEVRESYVTTNYIEVLWQRKDKWFGVEEFNITTTPQHGAQCVMETNCTEQTCIFNTTPCGHMDPCTSISVVVSGGNYTAPSLDTVTAPDGVSNVTALWMISIHVTWTNPDNESGSVCYEYTKVLLTYHNNVSTSLTLPHHQQSVEFPVCVEEDALVSIWTHGGHGDSSLQTSFVKYPDSAVVKTVENFTCEEYGRNGLNLTWDYSPVCTGVTTFLIEIRNRKTVLTDLTTRSYVFSDLEEEGFYDVRVQTVDLEGHVFGQSDWESCKTHQIVVENLEVVALSGVSAMSRWDPPLYQQQPRYDISIHIIDSGYLSQHNTTSDTNITWTQLDELTMYKVCVGVTSVTNRVTCADVTTLPIRPYWVKAETNGYDALEVTWDYGHEGENVMFQVLWGKELEHNHFTKDHQYTIEGYNSTENVVNVCVAANLLNSTSINTCLGDAPIPRPGDPYEFPTVPVVVGCVMGLVVIVAGVMAGVVYHRKKKANKFVAHKNSYNNNSYVT